MSTPFLITARLKSTRLPKKIMLEVMGKPLIVHMLDRIKHSRHIEDIVICTSTNSQDDPLEEIAEKEHVHCFRGSEDDVLERLLRAARSYDMTNFANITADCPLIDPLLIDRAVEEYDKVNADLVMYDDSNNNIPFNCYVLRVSALEKVCELKKETDTEVWLNLFTTHMFKIHSIIVEGKYRHNSLKISLDYPEDYEFIKKVFGELYDPDRVFSLPDVIDLANRRPDILSINANPELLKRWRGHQISAP
jgi:spore coat polysaccharide biosynthesis protein SpsF|tara:strand:- start:239 stop:985 length:747 start_codon:yes stop_codon:yes gene_type:complete